MSSNLPFEHCTLTPQQERKWEETRVALLWGSPAFAHIFYSMMNNVNSKYVALFTKDPRIPIAATDGATLILNPDTYFEFNLSERVFVANHEIMHCIHQHMVAAHHYKSRGKVTYQDGTNIPYEHSLMNQAQDYVINDLLVEASISNCTMPKDKAGQLMGLHDKTVGTSMDSAVDVYKKLYQDQKGGKGNGKPGPGKGFDEHLSPGTSQGKDPTQAVQQHDSQEWATAIAAAANSARAQGKLPAGLDRLFKELLNPAVDWREHIQGLFARRVGGGSYDWRKPDRRLITRDIYAPGRSGFGAGDVVIGADTSGSIGSRELDMFFAELSGILEDVKPKRLFIIWCDAKVHRVDEANDPGDLRTIRHKGAPGGGGTSFIPVFEEIRNQGIEPEVLVYLTDGYGTFPSQAPGYPCIWGNISPPGSVKYPFGDVVDVPKQAKR